MTLIAAAAGPGTNNWVITLVLAVISLFGGGSLVAFFRLRKEGPKIIVEAAQGAVVVQSGVIDDLRDDLERAKKEISDLRSQLIEASLLQRRVRELEQREETLTAENTRLKSQVRDLQNRISQLEGRAP